MQTRCASRSDRSITRRVKLRLGLFAIVLAVLAGVFSSAAALAGASVIVAEDGLLGLARFSYDAPVDVAPGPTVESTGLVPRVDQTGSAVAAVVGPSGHVLDQHVFLVAPSGLADDVIGRADASLAGRVGRDRVPSELRRRSGARLGALLVAVAT